MKSTNQKKVLKLATRLHKELLTGAPSERWKVSRKGSLTILKIYKLEAAYQKLKSSDPDIHIAFLEGDSKMSETDKETLRKANAINREIGRLLRERSKAQ